MIFKNTRVGVFLCPRPNSSTTLNPLSFRSEFNSCSEVTFEGRRHKVYYNTTDDWDCFEPSMFEKRLLAQPSTVHIRRPHQYDKGSVYVHLDTFTAYTAMFEVDDAIYPQDEIILWLQDNIANWYDSHLPWCEYAEVELNRVWFEDHNDALAFKMRWA